MRASSGIDIRGNFRRTSSLGPVSDVGSVVLDLGSIASRGGRCVSESGRTIEGLRTLQASSHFYSNDNNAGMSATNNENIYFATYHCGQLAKCLRPPRLSDTVRLSPLQDAVDATADEATLRGMTACALDAKNICTCARAWGNLLYTRILHMISISAAQVTAAKT